jgi:DNA repair protein RadC
MKPSIYRNDAGLYRMRRPVSADELIHFASNVIAEHIGTPGEAIANPAATRRYLRLQLAREEQEIFAALFLDSQHRVIAFEKLFFGTLDGASVYPREVVKRSLTLNAAAVIFAHNHPSGVPEPSTADRQITRRLTDALALVDIRVLDHIIIGGNDAVSFAERGLL